jgi:hypothetical protein
MGNEMVLAATAVRATVAKALRFGKTASHRPHFTAILHGAEAQPVEFPQQPPSAPSDDKSG